MENNKIVIPFRMSFVIFLLLCGIILVASGIYILIVSFNDLPEPIENWLLFNPIIMRLIGIICIIFFGFVFVIIIRKLLDKNPGLIIDNIEIIDNSTGYSAKHIKWENIKYFKRYNFLIIQFIVVIVDNHDEVVKKNKNKLFQTMAKMDYKLVCSSYNIYLNMLKCKPKILFNILQEELNKKININD